MAGVARINVRIPWVEPLVRGPVSSNQWHFGTSGPMDATTISDILDLVEAFYTTGMSGLFSSLCDTTYTMTCYDAEAAAPVLPFAERAGTLAPAVTSSVAEAAITLSYRATYEIGVLRQRFRGRISLGPLGSTVIDDTGHVDVVAMDQVETATNTLYDDLISGSPNWSWVVGSSALGWKPNNVVKIANEPGTVRRRQNTRTDVRTILHL